MNSRWLESSVKCHGHIEQVIWCAFCFYFNRFTSLCVSEKSSLVWTWQWTHCASWSRVNRSWHWSTSNNQWVGRRDLSFVSYSDSCQGLFDSSIPSSLTWRSVHTGIFAHRLHMYFIHQIPAVIWSFKTLRFVNHL